MVRLHCKKVPVLFPAQSRDITGQTLSSHEYISLMKPGVFPNITFPSPEFSKNPLNQLVFLIAGRSFPDIPLLQQKILPRSLITRLCFFPGDFLDFPLPQTGILIRAFGQSSPVLIFVHGYISFIFNRRP
jgi:hypothetical protein